jgi:hypothetical protein
VLRSSAFLLGAPGRRFDRAEVSAQGGNAMFNSLRRSRAIVGMLAVGAAAAFSSLAIVRAQGPQPNKIYHCTSGTACVGGSSTVHGTWGVWGIAPSDGVVGVTTATNGKAGVRGLSSERIGIGYGVVGRSLNGHGVVGISEDKTGAGVIGVNEKGVAVEAESKAHGASSLVSVAGGGHTGIFLGYNSTNGANCTIDADANLSCSGNIGAGSTIETTHRNDRGERVQTFAAESASATVEDVGTARMAGGVANVRFDSGFAAIMDRRWYYVFLTPLGDTRGLYVSMKTPQGFQVRESEHGRSTLAFDYRIVAHPVDAGDERLPASPR